MTILKPDEVANVAKIMDFILKYPNRPVESIREKFGITSDEYNMIYEFCMPIIRVGNRNAYWKQKYFELSHDIADRLHKEDCPSKLSDDIWCIIVSNGVGKSNKNAQNDAEEELIEAV